MKRAYQQRVDTYEKERHMYMVTRSKDHFDNLERTFRNWKIAYAEGDTTSTCFHWRLFRLMAHCGIPQVTAEQIIWDMYENR